MKILQVLHGFPPEMNGGTESAVAALSKAMQVQGHELIVLAGSIHRGSSEAVDEEQVAGLRVLRMHRDDLYFENWDKAWSPSVSARFARLLTDERPDFVHVHHWLRLSSDLLRITARQARCCAVTCHDYYSLLARPLRGIGEDRAEPPAGHQDMTAAECDEAFAFHRADFLEELAAADLRYVPSAAHGLGLRELASGELGELRTSTPTLSSQPARRPDPGEARGHRLLLWGSLYPDKGVGMVLDALNSIGGDWSLDLLGEAHDPEFRRQLEAQAGIAKVRFHGAYDRDQLCQIPADYAILPSMCHESYGLVLDEAQCLGLPTLAADLPAYREHAQLAATAFFPPADPGALAMLLLDEKRLQALVRPEAPSLVTAEQAAAALLVDYQKVLDRGPSALAGGEALDRSRAQTLFDMAERRYRG